MWGWGASEGSVPPLNFEKCCHNTVCKEGKWKRSICPSHAMASLYFRKLPSSLKEWGRYMPIQKNTQDRPIAEPHVNSNVNHVFQKLQNNIIYFYTHISTYMCTCMHMHKHSAKCLENIRQLIIAFVLGGIIGLGGQSRKTIILLPSGFSKKNLFFFF